MDELGSDLVVSGLCRHDIPRLPQVMVQAARNPDVIDVLRRFSLAEDAGRGIDVIQDEMEDALLDGSITPRERAWVTELERRGEILSPDKLLLVHAARGNELTNSSARSVLKTEDPGIARKALKRLCEAGLLEQRGERGGYLNEAISPPAGEKGQLF